MNTFIEFHTVDEILKGSDERSDATNQAIAVPISVLEETFGEGGAVQFSLHLLQSMYIVMLGTAAGDPVVTFTKVPERMVRALRSGDVQRVDTLKSLGVKGTA